MATIPVQATGLRHVRKTITFTGGANAGALGDTIPCFTITGRVMVVYGSAYVSTAFTCAAGAATGFSVGVTGHSISNPILSALAGTADSATLGTWAAAEAFTETVAMVAQKMQPVAANIVGLVSDLGGGAAITAGVVVIDLWYLPITDDGALAGDDIDLELGAYLADKVLDEALSEHTTAGSAGKAIADIETDVDAVLVDTGTTLQAELDGIQADTEDIQSRLPAALVNGRIDATIDGTGMESGAIDAILTRQMTESYSADGAAPTLAQALFEIMQCLTEFSISGTTITVKKRDGSTTAMTFTLNSATAPTSRTRAT